MFKCAVQFNKSVCYACTYLCICMRMYACKVCICTEINLMSIYLSGCVVRETEKVSFQENQNKNTEELRVQPGYWRNQNPLSRRIESYQRGKIQTKTEKNRKCRNETGDD